MNRNNKRTISIVLSLIGCVLLVLYIILPVFSFWNYRLLMIGFLPVCIISFLSSAWDWVGGKDYFCGTLIIVFTCITAYIGSYLSSIFVCAATSILIALILFVQGRFIIFSKRTLAVLSVLTAVITTLCIQANTIYERFDWYEMASSDLSNLPSYVADSMLISAFNEIGIMIAVFSLNLCLTAVFIKYSNCEENSAANVETQDLYSSNAANVWDSLSIQSAQNSTPPTEEECITSNPIIDESPEKRQ